MSAESVRSTGLPSAVTSVAAAPPTLFWSVTTIEAGRAPSWSLASTQTLWTLAPVVSVSCLLVIVVTVPSVAVPEMA